MGLVAGSGVQFGPRPFLGRAVGANISISNKGRGTCALLSYCLGGDGDWDWAGAYGALGPELLLGLQVGPTWTVYYVYRGREQHMSSSSSATVSSLQWDEAWFPPPRLGDWSLVTSYKYKGYLPPLHKSCWGPVFGGFDFVARRGKVSSNM